jgi:predicted acylesterase/phospholipase RssA
VEFPRVGVITIQGGGAVAIDLIGQLQGLTGRRQDENGQLTGDQGIIPAAVAGTSAGAIVATLYWAGYSPESIRDQVVCLFARSKLNTFFGRAGRLFPIRFVGFAAVATAASAFLRGWTSFVGHIVWPRRHWYLLPLLPFSCIWQATSLSFRFFAILRALVHGRGIFPGDGMVREIDHLLRDSPLLSPHKDSLPAGGRLRFYDVNALHLQTMPLFLIVTDVRSADVSVVSSIDPASANIEIATAARASGSFPGFFQPVRLSDRYDTCIDGGVISNFPAWVFGFDYRRSLLRSGNALLAELAYSPWLHVGLRLSANDVPSPHDFDGFIRGLVGLITGRARARLDDKLATVMVKRRSVNPSPVPSDAGPRNVLDFTALSDPTLVTAAFNRGRTNGQQCIEPDCFALPDPNEIKPILAAVVDRAAFLLKEWLVSDSRVRANIFIPQGSHLVLTYQFNMDGDPDEHIRLSRGQGISFLAYSRRATVIADLRGRRQTGGTTPSGSDLYLTSDQAPAILADRTWLLSMPLIDVTEMWPDLQFGRGDPAPFSLEIDGPILGTLNVDAAIDYDRDGAPSPDHAANHVPALALFDVLKSAALRCSMVFNRRFLR